MKTMTRYIAAAAIAALASVAQAATDPRSLVQTTTDTVMERVRAEHEVLRQNPEQIFTLVNEVVFPHFDFPRISQWVLGKYWKEAGEAEREEFILEFRRLLVRTYSNALLEFYNSSITYGDVEQKPGGKTATVVTSISSDDSSAVPIKFRLHSNDGPWKVFDVSVDGVSLVSTYRASFAAEIRKSGITGLIATLNDKNQQ